MPDREPTTCTCGGKSICLTCQLAELNLTPILALHRLEQRLAADPVAREAVRGQAAVEAALVSGLGHRWYVCTHEGCSLGSGHAAPHGSLRDFEDPTRRVEATTTPEGAKGWADRDGSAQFPAGGHGLNVAPDASPEGIRAEARRHEQEGSGGEPSNAPTAYVYAWGNNPVRAGFKGRKCVIEARGRMRTVLIRFLDTGERTTTSVRALRRTA
jgi:hypothetical protein